MFPWFDPLCGVSQRAAVSVVLSMGRSGWLGMTVGLMVLAFRLPRRWVIPLVSGFVVAIVFYVWGYVQGYWAVEYKIRRENMGIGEQPAAGRPGTEEDE